MNNYILPIFFLLLLIMPHLSNAADWSPWAQLDDGALNGIEFSHRSDCPSSGKESACTLFWRFLSNYENPVEVEYTISWGTTKGIKSKIQRAKLKPGENSPATFTVTGTALEDVSARIVADKQTLNAARQSLTEAQQLQEQQQRQAQEQEEQARAAEEQKVRDRQRFAALTRKEQQRREDETRQQQDEQARQQQEAAYRQQEEAYRQQEEANQAKLDRQQSRQEEEERQARSDAADRRQRTEEKQMWNDAIANIGSSLQGSANRTAAAWNRVGQINQEVAEQNRRQQEERDRKAEADRQRQQRAAQDQRDRDEARRTEQAQARERAAQAQRQQDEQKRVLLAQAAQTTRQNGATREESPREDSRTKKETYPGGKLDHCITLGYTQGNIASYADAYFVNTCSSAVTLDFYLKQTNHCWGTLNLSPGKQDRIGGFCDKKKVEEGGGFVMAVCPVDFIALTQNGSIWGASHKLESYYCEKRH